MVPRGAVIIPFFKGPLDPVLKATRALSRMGVYEHWTPPI